MRTSRTSIKTLGVTILVALAVQLKPHEVTAADHDDAPAAMANAAADLAGLHAWPTANGTVVMVLTFAGNRREAAPAPYDSGVLYTIHIDNTADPAEKRDYSDNDNDNVSDLQIRVRFGQNASGQWGVQFNGVPGAADATFSAPVDATITNGAATVTAGTFDDPSFFDADGLATTLANLRNDTAPVDLAIESDDTLASSNAKAIVVEVPIAAVVGGNRDNFIQLWATTGVTP